jgi:ActR/RegA family two-component response regulator
VKLGNLILDDSVTFTASAMRLLESQGVETAETTTTGADALAAWRRKPRAWESR